MNRILVIGATGMSGRQVVSQFAGQGCASPRARAQPADGWFAATCWCGARRPHPPRDPRWMSGWRGCGRQWTVNTLSSLRSSPRVSPRLGLSAPRVPHSRRYRLAGKGYSILHGFPQAACADPDALRAVGLKIAAW